MAPMAGRRRGLPRAVSIRFTAGERRGQEGKGGAPSALDDLGFAFFRPHLALPFVLHANRAQTLRAWGGKTLDASKQGAGVMAIQSVVVVGVISVCGTIAASMTRHGLPGRWGWIGANAVVVVVGILALAFALDWAGWLTTALFVLLVVSPLALLDRARVAAQRGQWQKAARLQVWAVLLHPSSWARIGLRLRRARSIAGPAGYMAALGRIEATGSGRQKAFARLMLAQERRDWDGVLVLARARGVDYSEAKPREIRALGELGHLEEMVQTYAEAEKWLLPQLRQECRLFVFAFMGLTGAVQQLLGAALSAMDDEAKAYWSAVARLGADRHDEVGRATLLRLAETGTSEGVRRSAAQHLQRAVAGEAPAPSSEETERIVERMLQSSARRLREPQVRPPLFRASAKAHIRGLLLLALIVVLALLQRFFR